MTTKVLWILLLVVIVLVLLTINWARLDPGQAELRALRTDNAFERERELQPLRLWAGRIWQGVLIAAGIALIAWAISLAVAGLTSVLALRDKLIIWSLSSRPRNALYAAPVTVNGRSIRIEPPPNAGHSQEVAALTNGSQPPPRLGAGMRHLLTPPTDEPPLLEAPKPPAELLPAEVVQPDPAHRSILAVAGASGAGKTNLLHWAVNTYQRAVPDAEFMILSTLGSNWPGMPVVTEPLHILAAVQALDEEIAARDRSMKAQGVMDIHRWPEAPHPVVVVVDEAENVVDKLSVLLNRTQAAEFTKLLRIVIKTGRNARLLFIVGSQTFDADILDPAAIENAGTTLIGRVGSRTAQRFGFQKPEQIAMFSNLEVGQFYSVERRAVVRFPHVARLPQVRASTIYRPALALPADAEADGQGPADLPDGSASEVVFPLVSGVVSGEGVGFGPAESGSTGTTTRIPHEIPAQIPPGTTKEEFVQKLTPAQRSRIIGTYRRTLSYRAVERVLWPGIQHGGDKFYVVRAVVEQAIAEGTLKEGKA